MLRIQTVLALSTQEAIGKAQRAGDLAQLSIPDVVIERPKSADWGDYATAVCLALARDARLAPIEIARRVVQHFPAVDFVGSVSVAPPGFINWTLDTGWLQRQVDEVLQTGEHYADVDLGHGRRVQVEYGSANPTGPLHMGFGRNVVLGDGIANVLAAAGYQVQREYYVNDAGTQMGLFAQTLYARYAQALGEDVPVPDQGYMGQYMIDWGREIADQYGRQFLGIPREEAVDRLKQIGLHEKVLTNVRADCLALGIHYHLWFHETTLYQQGQFEKVMSILKENGLLVQREGATWFAASHHDPALKDEVVVRSNGLPGYFASDIAYHYNKLVERGFDWVIDVWGADHQGHVPRMMAMMRGLGLDPARLTLVLYQLVTIKQGGEDIRLSKRAGTLVYLSELIREVGADAVRFTLLSRAADSQMEFDVDLAKEQSDRNPVYYVQYAHARMASLLREAEERGFSGQDANVQLLVHPAEITLIRKMVELGEVIEKAAVNLAPHHLTYYAQELATIFTLFYRDCRVLPRKTGETGASAQETAARLQLVRAAQVILARTLRLMGMGTPESM